MTLRNACICDLYDVGAIFLLMFGGLEKKRNKIIGLFNV